MITQKIILLHRCGQPEANGQGQAHMHLNTTHHPRNPQGTWYYGVDGGNSPIPPLATSGSIDWVLLMGGPKQQVANARAHKSHSSSEIQDTHLLCSRTVCPAGSCRHSRRLRWAPVCCPCMGLSVSSMVFVNTTIMAKHRGCACGPEGCCGFEEVSNTSSGWT